MSEPERNAPCSCGSGTKFKKCCGDPRNLRVWLFDHRYLTEVWDTQARDEAHARRNFTARWNELEAAGALPMDAVRSGFTLGVVGLDPEQKAPTNASVPKDPTE